MDNAPRVIASSRRDARRGLHSVGWMTLAQAVGMALRLMSGLILTRLLAPEAYGLVGPALAVLMTLEWLCDLGIRQALVREPAGGTSEFLGTGWWIGLLRGGCLSAAAASLAMPLAAFYGQPELAGVLAVLALLPLLQSLQSPGLPVLRRELNYRALFSLEVGQSLAATAVTLAAGWLLHSAWAIVAGTLAGAAAAAAISFWISPVRTIPSWDRPAARRLLRVSRPVLLNTLLMALLLNSDRLFGLRLVSIEAMGLYAVAWNLAGVFDSLLSRGCDVYYSLLARTTDPVARTVRHHRVCRSLAWVMPGLAVGVVAAPWAVWLLYDPRYAGSGIPFALLMARLMARALGQVQFQYLMANADLRRATLAYLAAILVQAGTLIPLALRYGVIGLAGAGVLSAAVLTLTQSILLWRRGEGRLAPCLLTLGSMALAVCLLLRMPELERLYP